MLFGASLVAAVIAVPAVAAGADTGSGGSGRSSAPQLSNPIATGFAGPLQMAIDDDTIYVAQDFAGVLTALHDGQRTDVATNPGGEIAGVDVGRGHGLLYTTTNGNPQAGTTTAAALNRLGRGGDTSVVADTLAYETSANPDQAVSYGFESISDSCAAQWPVDQLGPPQYTGKVDSHPYAVAVSGTTTYVADAAGNDILAVDRNGRIRTVAVLPAQPLVLSADAVAATHLPDCVVGLTYDFEAVPTDVEVGHDGMLYVTTLPGGPEDPGLGARGSVYRVNPRTGAARRLATGFAGAVNLALGDRGDIFVSELFANRVSRVSNGGPATVVAVNAPSALEFSDGRLYVSYDSLPPANGAPDGKVARIDLGHR